MVATGQWDVEAQMPIARPLAAADLFRDQSARNGMTTLEAAARRGGFRFERLVASCSDGTEHAVQESEGFCKRAQELSPPRTGFGDQGRQLAQADFCCIHGKALEENGGMQAAFGDNYLVDALRLLWEVVCGPEGRPRFYRGIWGRKVQLPPRLILPHPAPPYPILSHPTPPRPIPLHQVVRRDGTTLPELPVVFFDQNLRVMPEPTEAKWQVMFDTCSCISKLLDSFGSILQVGARRCYLEIFFEKCLVLFCGSTDQSKAKRTPHPHILKMQLLNGIFGKPDVYAAIYLTIDAWEQNYEAFHKFARSPSAYGDFAPPFLRHMMAEQAAKDVTWYRAARAQPRQHLPRFYAFIGQSRWRDFAELMGVRFSIVQCSIAWCSIVWCSIPSTVQYSPCLG